MMMQTESRPSFLTTPFDSSQSLKFTFIPQNHPNFVDGHANSHDNIGNFSYLQSWSSFQDSHHHQEQLNHFGASSASLTSTGNVSPDSQPICFKKRAGPKRKHFPTQEKERKRSRANEQERQRMRQINVALDVLRNVLRSRAVKEFHQPPVLRYERHKESKIKTLKTAIAYIKFLKRMKEQIDQQERAQEPIPCDSRPRPSIDYDHFRPLSIDINNFRC